MEHLKEEIEVLGLIVLETVTPIFDLCLVSVTACAIALSALTFMNTL